MNIKRRRMRIDWQRPPVWVLADYVMTLLGINEETLKTLVEEGVLPSYKLDDKLFFDKHEVDDFIRYQRVIPVRKTKRPEDGKSVKTERPED
jgi:hypothetical protein